jgi:HEAT repeat protein
MFIRPLSKDEERRFKGRPERTVRCRVQLLFFIPLMFFPAACHGKAPYEGKSVGELEQMLNDADEKVQAQGAYGLSQLGPAARDSVPALAAALKRGTMVRQNAALALGQIGPEAVAAVPDLAAALKDSEWTVRRQVAVALGQIGEGARPAMADLLKLTHDRNQTVKKAAQEAVSRIEPRRK